MPPKRKRAEEGTTGEASESAAAPRRSNRSKATTADPAPAKTTTKKTTKAPAASAVTGDEPASKRKKTTKVETADKPPAKRGRKKADAGDAEPAAPSATKAPAAAKPSAKEPVPEAVAKPPSPIKAKTKPAKNEPYTPKRAQDLFSQYADSDDPNVIGPEGFEQLFTEADIPMDGALPLLLAWQMGAKEMAKISKEEWTKGTESLKIASLGSLSIALDDLENLLVSAKPPLKRSAKPDQDPYDRTLYFLHANDVDGAFSKFYSYCFSLAKPEGSRNIDMETSAAFWTVLLTKRYPIMLEVVEFINDKKDTYRATNKDLWSMMLEFCQTVKPTLEDYEADGAWPTLLDDFAQWKKTNKGANPNGA